MAAKNSSAEIAMVKDARLKHTDWASPHYFSAAIRVMQMVPANEEDLASLSLLAKAYVNSKLWQKALPVANRLVARYPLEHETRYVRAVVLSNLNQIQPALDDLAIWLKDHKPNNGHPAIEFATEQKVRLLRISLYGRQGKRDMVKKEKSDLDAIIKQSYRNALFRTPKNQSNSPSDSAAQ